jgi:beta-1,4-mannosyl-glycoprotein beta-1,4-N-acetylglucosaminyltransferase
MNGLYDANQNDIIIVSDLDEIPNLSQINLFNLDDKIYAFKQINTMYKFNMVRDYNWIGSKLCKFKKLKSPQWMRSLKVHKRYSYLRIDKLFSSNYIHSFKIIKNGGWHFGWIRNINEIINKLDSFAHTEFNNIKFKNYEYINECINKNINFLNTNEILTKIDISLLPGYLVSNKNKFKDYLK